MYKSCERATAQKSTSSVVSRRCNRTMRGDVPFKWHLSTTYNRLKEHATRSNTRSGYVYRYKIVFHVYCGISARVASERRRYVVANVTPTPFSLFLIKLTSKFMIFVGTLTTRHEARDDEKARTFFKYKMPESARSDLASRR